MTASCAFLVTSLWVFTTIPSATGFMHEGTRAGPRPVSTSTMQIRHMPTGFIRGCQQKRGM